MSLWAGDRTSSDREMTLWDLKEGIKQVLLVSRRVCCVGLTHLAPASHDIH